MTQKHILLPIFKISLKQLAVVLLDLVVQKGQHHNVYEHSHQILATIKKSILQVIALVFQGVKLFVMV